MPISEFILCRLFGHAGFQARLPGLRGRLHNSGISPLLTETHRLPAGTHPRAPEDRPGQRWPLDFLALEV